LDFTPLKLFHSVGLKGVAEGFTTKAGAGPILLVILSTSEESRW